MNQWSISPPSCLEMMLSAHRWNPSFDLQKLRTWRIKGAVEWPWQVTSGRSGHFKWPEAGGGSWKLLWTVDWCRCNMLVVSNRKWWWTSILPVCCLLGSRFYVKLFEYVYCSTLYYSIYYLELQYIYTIFKYFYCLTGYCSTIIEIPIPVGLQFTGANGCIVLTSPDWAPQTISGTGGRFEASRVEDAALVGAGGGLQIGQNCGLPILVSKYLHRNMSESGMIDPSTSKSTSISWYFSGVWFKFQLGSSCLKICFFNLARPSIASTRCGSTKMVCRKLFEPVGCAKISCFYLVLFST